MSVPAQTRTKLPAAARIDFGWLGQAWTLFSAQAGVWIGAMLLCFFLDAAVWVLLAIPTGMMASMQRAYALVVTHTLVPSAVGSYQEFAQTRIFSILLAAVSAVFAGGLYRMALRQRRGEPVSLLSLFSALPQSLPLLLVGAFTPAVLGLLEGAGLWGLHFFQTPARAVSIINIAFWLPELLLRGLVMFAPLFVVDAGTNAPEAVLGSVRLLGRQWPMGILFYVVASLVGGLGIILCGLGMLATYPVFLLSIAIGYFALTQPDAAADPPALDPAPVGIWPPPPRVPEEEQQ